MAGAPLAAACGPPSRCRTAGTISLKLWRKAGRGFEGVGVRGVRAPPPPRTHPQTRTRGGGQLRTGDMREGGACQLASRCCSPCPRRIPHLAPAPPPHARVSFALSYVVLAWVGYCLYQHYKSFALLRLLHLRVTHPAGERLRTQQAPPSEQSLPTAGCLLLARLRPACVRLARSLLTQCRARTCASGPACPAGGPPRMAVVGMEPRGWPAVRDVLLKLFSPLYVRLP